jgi:hypothetical protein
VTLADHICNRVYGEGPVLLIVVFADEKGIELQLIFLIKHHLMTVDPHHNGFDLVVEFINS